MPGFYDKLEKISDNIDLRIAAYTWQYTKFGLVGLILALIGNDRARDLLGLLSELEWIRRGIQCLNQPAHKSCTEFGLAIRQDDLEIECVKYDLYADTYNDFKYWFLPAR